MDETVQTLKRFHRRILQRTFPEAFGIDDDALPTFASPTANTSRNRKQQQQFPSFAEAGTTKKNRRRKRRPESLVEMVMDTTPVPPFGQSRFITYSELKCKIERDREAGTKTVGAIHGAMLRQICGNVKVQAIRQSFPTPASLLQAYDDVAGNPKTQAELVADCVDTSNSIDGKASRKVGPKTASEVYIAYCSTPYEEDNDGESEEETRPSSTKTNVTAAAASKRSYAVEHSGMLPNTMPGGNTTTAKFNKRPRVLNDIPPRSNTAVSDTFATKQTNTTAAAESIEDDRLSSPSPSSDDDDDDDDNSVGLNGFVKRMNERKNKEREKKNTNIQHHVKPNVRTQNLPNEKDIVMLPDSSSDDGSESDSEQVKKGSTNNNGHAYASASRGRSDANSDKKAASAGATASEAIEID